MREKQSAAEKIFWPLQAGRRKYSKVGLIEAVSVGRTFANKLEALLTNARLDPKDGYCFLVFAKGTKLAFREQFDRANKDSCDLAMAKRAHDKRAEPIGLIFWVVDRDKKNLLLHARPFEELEYVENILAACLDEALLLWRQGKISAFN